MKNLLDWPRSLPDEPTQAEEKDAISTDDSENGPVLYGFAQRSESSGPIVPVGSYAKVDDWLWGQVAP